MHNLKNSNVLDISFDASPYKAELLNVANESTYRLLNQGLDTKEEQKVLDNSFEIYLVDYLAKVIRSQDDIKTDPSKIVDFLKKSDFTLNLIR